MEITVSPLNMEELPEALAVIRESYDTLLAPSMEPEGNRDFYRFACLEEMKKRFSSSLFLAAREGGRIVGMLECALGKKPHLRLFYVLPSRVREGIGGRLFSSLLERLAEECPKARRLTVNASPYAEEIYRALGFRHAAARTCKNGLWYRPMRKKLPLSPRRRKARRIRRRISLAALLLLLAAAAGIGWWGTHLPLTVTEYTVRSDKLPADFGDCVIAVVSDLHNAEFGERNALLAEKIREAGPDFILVPGDTQGYTRDPHSLDAFRGLMEQLGGEYPVYVTRGNHDWYAVSEENPAPSMQNFVDGIESTGAVYLHNKVVTVEHNGTPLILAGIEDDELPSIPEVQKYLPGFTPDPEQYHIVVTHMPFGRFALSEFGFDLMICGHYHGGIFRLPGIGGLLSPYRTLNPSIDKGQYTYGNMTMILSAGLGEAEYKWLPRFNNPPELVIVHLTPPRQDAP